MIYGLGRTIVHWVKSVLHFFRALFCDEWKWLEGRGGICRKESNPYIRICYCRYYNCPKLKGADDEF